MFGGIYFGQLYFGGEVSIDVAEHDCGGGAFGQSYFGQPYFGDGCPTDSGEVIVVPPVIVHHGEGGGRGGGYVTFETDKGIKIKKLRELYRREDDEILIIIKAFLDVNKT